MQPATLETPARTDESRKLEARKPRLDMLSEIVNEIFPWSGEADARLLWVRGDVSFYRVNWWRMRPGTYDHYIARSALVAIEQTPNGPVVRDLTRP
jgi:hypothetical protein